jgi:glutamate-1-semialdehyde 2,1-aminomutase
MNNQEKNISNQLLKSAHSHMPMGVADSYRYWGEEKTVFVKSTQGCKITDCDDQEFVDFRLAYGPIILGYRDQTVDLDWLESIAMSAMAEALEALNQERK